MRESVVIEDATLPGLSRYRIRADGAIVSLWGKEPKILRGGDDKDGYRKFVLIADDGERRHVRRATLVCTAFHGPSPIGMTVRHADGTRQNDSRDNLSWATHSDNCMDKVAHGTAQRGSRNGNAVINEDIARQIKASNAPPAVIAARLGIARHIVRNIRYGNCWKWLSVIAPEPAAQPVQESLL